MLREQKSESSWSGQLQMSFASWWLLLAVLKSSSVFSVYIFSTLRFAAVPWVLGEVLEAEDEH